MSYDGLRHATLVSASHDGASYGGFDGVVGHASYGGRVVSQDAPFIGSTSIRLSISLATAMACDMASRPSHDAQRGVP